MKGTFVNMVYFRSLSNNSPAVRFQRAAGVEESRIPLGVRAGVLCLVLILNPAAHAQTSATDSIKAHYMRAQEAIKENKLDVAAGEFQQILQIDPHNAEVRASLGVIDFNERKYPDAAQEFRESLRLKPELWNAQAFLGMSEMRLGKLDEAQTVLEKSFPHVQDQKLRAQAGSDLVYIYYLAGNLDKAAAIVTVLESIQPDQPDTLYTEYRVYSDLAAHALATLIKVAPESARTHEILAQSLMSHNDATGALQEYRRALQADPNLPGIHFELGQALLAYSANESSRAEAEKEFEAALVANPSDANAEYELGEVAWSRSDFQSALGHYSRALQVRPHYIDAQIGMGKALTSTNQASKAVDYLLDAERADPENEIVHYRLALAYRKLGTKPDADREWAKFQEIRKSQDASRLLFQEMQQKPVTPQTDEPDRPQ
ncbi:MAG TPA: tetratricopeptide repeat protein [Terriglobia bacterium]|jgi:tetratricopeptide (TPR) repeat protein|nr:tetratricopeptide repeat protein [Terriglobia bacterium]